MEPWLLEARARERERERERESPNIVGEPKSRVDGIQLLASLFSISVEGEDSLCWQHS